MSTDLPNPDTTPTTENPPSQPALAAAPRPRATSRAGVLVIVIALVVGAVAGGAFASVTGLRVLPGPAARVVAPSTREAATTAADAAVKDAIRRANDAQVQAFVARDATAMRGSSTAQHYDELVRINDDLRRGGVTSIQLVSLRFGDVTVSGTSAQATTFETWRSTLADGTTDESTDRNDYSLVLQNGVWLVDGDAQPESASRGSGGTPPGSRPLPQGSGVRDTSSNWSGYAASGGTFTAVSGTWIVPQPSTTTSGVDATWVGIGGMTSNDLIQAGTQAMVTGRGGVQYEAWVELLPHASQPVPLTVGPGDTVTVSITQQSEGRWLVAMNNDTTGRTYSTTVTYASSNTSAEWVQEAPSSGRRVIPLDDFGTLRFTRGATVKDGTTVSIRDAGARAITMIDRSGRTLAIPSALGADGASFTVTRV